MAQRITYRRRHCYNTKGNKIRKVKTPGGRLVVHYPKKAGTHPKCAISGVRIQGVKARRPVDYASGRMPRGEKSVTRAYGGSMSAKCVRERIIRAFLVEEQKIVKKVLKIQKSKEKAAAPKA
eukprot:jgi/Mesvir1/10100/Mv06973-RA.1